MLKGTHKYLRILVILLCTSTYDLDGGAHHVDCHLNYDILHDGATKG